MEMAWAVPRAILRHKFTRRLALFFDGEAQFYPNAVSLKYGFPRLEIGNTKPPAVVEGLHRSLTKSPQIQFTQQIPAQSSLFLSNCMLFGVGSSQASAPAPAEDGRGCSTRREEERSLHMYRGEARDAGTSGSARLCCTGRPPEVLSSASAPRSPCLSCWDFLPRLSASSSPVSVWPAVVCEPHARLTPLRD